MKKAPLRHHGRNPRLPAPRVTADEAQIVTTTEIIIEVAPGVSMGHLGVLEGILGQLWRNSLRGRKKVGIKEPQK
jgi:hypothetical protein